MKEWCKRKTAWIYVIYAVLTLGLIIRAKYGFCWTDEAYYVSGANRFLCGDRVITDEWYMTQLFSIILYPVVAVYKYFWSLDGIYLFFRILYVLMQTIFAILFYKLMTKMGIESVPSFSVSLVFLFYCKAYICTLSYYSVIFMAFGFLLLFLYSYQENNIKKAMAIGICLSIVSLINPYFIGLYLLALLMLLVANVKKSRVNSQTLNKINFLFLFYGLSILLCVLLAGIIVFRGNSVSDILQCIPIILDDDNYNQSLWWKLLHAFLYMMQQFKYTVILMFSVFLGSIYLLWKRKLTGSKRTVIFLCSFIIFVINCLDSGNWNGGIQTAFAFFGLQCFILDKNRNWKVFTYFYLPGILMAILMNLSSDTAFNAMALGFTIAGGISCIFVYDYIKNNGSNKLVYGIGMLSICIVVIIPAFFRFYVVYRDSGLLNLRMKITEGPAKGLYTTNDHKKQYEEVLEVMQIYCNKEGTVFISSWCPWAYLCTDMKCGAFTTWSLRMENSEEKLMKYYELYPERIPDIVIELNDDVGKIDIIGKFPDIDWLSTTPQADLKRNESFLWKYMEEHSYKKILVTCGTVYISTE